MSMPGARRPQVFYNAPELYIKNFNPPDDCQGAARQDVCFFYRMKNNHAVICRHERKAGTPVLTSRKKKGYKDLYRSRPVRFPCISRTPLDRIWFELIWNSQGV